MISPFFSPPPQVLNLKLGDLKLDDPVSASLLPYDPALLLTKLMLLNDAMLALTERMLLKAMGCRPLTSRMLLTQINQKKPSIPTAAPEPAPGHPRASSPRSLWNSTHVERAALRVCAGDKRSALTCGSVSDAEREKPKEPEPVPEAPPAEDAGQANAVDS
eukprot:386459-Rhodomonas_salina.1